MLMLIFSTSPLIKFPTLFQNKQFVCFMFFYPHLIVIFIVLRFLCFIYVVYIFDIVYVIHRSSTYPVAASHWLVALVITACCMEWSMMEMEDVSGQSL